MGSGRFEESMGGEPVHMSYRILMPVVCETENIKSATSMIGDKSKLILVENFDHPPTLELCDKLKSEGATIVPFEGDNRGCAAAWNYGMRMLENDIEMCMIISPAELLLKKAESIMAEAFSWYRGNEPTKMNKYYYRIHSYHCFIPTRRAFKEVGLFDENIYPAGAEDNDYDRRMKFAWHDQGYCVADFDWHSTSVCAWYSQGNSRINAGAMPIIREQTSANLLLKIKYYVDKWGGVPVKTYPQFPFMERWNTPYNKGGSVRDWIPDFWKKITLQDLGYKGYGT